MLPTATQGLRQGMSNPVFSLARTLPATVLASVLLSGCATLATSGPTGAELTRSARETTQSMGIDLVQVINVDQLPQEKPRAVAFTSSFIPPPTDMVGPGDVLDIAVYEAGVTLFSGTGTRGVATVGSGFDPSAQVERLPPNRIDDDGYIRLPYVGRLHVMGRTTTEIETMIKRGLRGMSQNPQVLVNIREAITNSVILGGEVMRPGRLVLPTNRESLLDAVALAGGYRGDAKDLAVRVQRSGKQIDLRLSDVLNGAENDFRVFPGDRISLIRSPRTFSVMGAPGRVEQFVFSGPGVSLAEALAMAGGANPNTGDAKAIFVFRFETDEAGVQHPRVYHLNMLEAGSFFLAQRFAMRDKDVLYVGNAAANQPSKLVQIISQLFAPIVTVGNLASTVGN